MNPATCNICMDTIGNTLLCCKGTKIACKKCTRVWGKKTCPFCRQTMKSSTIYPIVYTLNMYSIVRMSINSIIIS